MCEQEKLVAVISPWEKLSELVKEQFRVESLPKEKKVFVWREDLQDQETLEKALSRLGVREPEIRTKRVTVQWRDVQ